MTVQVAEGRIAGAVGQDALLNVNALTPDAIRAHCEAALLNAAPAALSPRSRLDTLFGANFATTRQQEENDESATYAIVAQQAIPRH